MRTRALALGVFALLALGVAAAALQAGAGPERANAAASVAVPAGSCEATSTTGSTHTAGGGALMISAGLNTLSDDSDRIVAGTVKSFRTCVDREAGGVSTDVTVHVTEHVKSPPGAASPSDVTFNVPGGKFGQLALFVGTSPEFTAGEQVVVFLQDAGGELRLTAGYQGKFSVAPNGEAAGGWGEAAFVATGTAWFPADMPVPYYVNAAEGLPPQLSAANVQTAWSNAFNTWQNDPGSDISFSFQGSTTRDSGVDQCGPAMPDGKNDLTWGIATAHGSSVLAVTYTCAMVFAGTDRIIDADIEFDADAAHFLSKWRTDGTGACNSGVIDLESVTLHESGHFIGLTHPTSNSCGANGGCPVMNASYQGVKRVLCQDDQDGVASVYPSANPPTPSPTMTAGPSPTSTFTPGPTATRTPTPLPTATLTPTPTRTPTSTRTPTNTPTVAPPTNTPTVAPPTNTPTVAPPTNTPTVAPPTNTPTVAAPTSTSTSAAPTNTPTVAPPTNTPTVAPPTNTPTVAAPTNTPVASATQAPATDTPTDAPTSTDTPAPAETATLTPTAIAPTTTPTETPTGAPTAIDTATSTSPPTAAPTETPTPTLTNTPTQTPTRTPTHVPPPASTTGDANCDGHMNSLDALAILQLSARLIDSLLCEDEADVNGNGRVDALDAALVLQYTAGIIASLSA